MNKCPKCGTEFDGKFCPNCGTEWQEEKSCPRCATKLAGDARFCNNCGYSFYETPAPAPAPAPAPVTAPVPTQTRTTQVPLRSKTANRLALFPFLLNLILTPVLFLFFLAPVAVTPSLGGESESYGNLYAMLGGLSSDGVKAEAPQLHFAVIALFTLALFMVLFTAYWVYCFLKSGERKMRLPCISVGLWFLIFVMSTVEMGGVAAFDECFGLFLCGAGPQLILSFSIIYCVFTGGVLYVRKRYPQYNATKNVPESGISRWVRSHKSMVIPVAVLLVVVIALIIMAPMINSAILSQKINGTYYRYEDKLFDRGDFYTLEDGKWTDGAGETGTYELDGDTIVFYEKLFGSNMEIASGTLTNGVIRISVGEIEMVYAKEGAVHVHSCDFVTDDTTHSGKCRSCSETVQGAHEFDVGGLCKVCHRTRSGLIFEYNNDNKFVLKDVDLGADIRQIVIPSTAGKNKTPVVSIGGETFSGCSGLTSITIPDSVTEIRGEAFFGCSSLESIIIPDSVTEIGYEAFSGCSSLEAVYYKGIAQSWDLIENHSTFNATLYYFTEEEPTEREWASHDWWWHYDPVTKEPTPWIKKDA